MDSGLNFFLWVFYDIEKPLLVLFLFQSKNLSSISGRSYNFFWCLEWTRTHTHGRRQIVRDRKDDKTLS